MLHKKICMLGSFAVGKSSLTERFTNSIFSERYHTTIGVRIHTRTVGSEGSAMKLVVWDLAGEDELVSVRTEYLRGSSGYLLVVDATRPNTASVAERLRETVESAVGKIPSVIAINKIDLVDAAATDAIRQRVEAIGGNVAFTSAKTGSGVDAAFLSLATKLVGS